MVFTKKSKLINLKVEENDPCNDQLNNDKSNIYIATITAIIFINCFCKAIFHYFHENIR